MREGLKSMLVSEGIGELAWTGVERTFGRPLDWRASLDVKPNVEVR